MTAGSELSLESLVSTFDPMQRIGAERNLIEEQAGTWI
jgi:hypothetical protein